MNVRIRTHWLTHSPIRTILSINSPINNSNLAYGLSFINDKIGPTVENTISVDLSYTIETSDTYKLSFGMKATANLFNLNIADLNPAIRADAQFQNLNNKFSPNIGAGVYFHSDKTYIGFSIPNFIETNRYNDNEVAIYKEKINYYFIAGHVFDINSSIKFKPALLTKMIEGAPIQLDLSANFMFNEKFVLGAAYRWDAAVSAMAGFQISNSMYIGYGFDLETTKLRHYNSGSHEIFLRYELFNNFNKIISPRFF